MQTESTNNTLVVHMRCPSCMKLYSLSILEITEDEPRFSCNSCQTLFMISLRDALESSGEVLAREMPAPEKLLPDERSLKAQVIASEIFTCPKCKNSHAAGDIECKKCGVIFLKFEEQLQKSYSQQNDNSFTSSPEVRALWDEVLNNYDNYQLHRNFIDAAVAAGCLDYAAHKYALILKVLPSDEMAAKAQKEIAALMTVKFETSTQTQLSRVVNVFTTYILILRRLKITNVIMFICMILIVMGMLLPHMRNLVGFGVAILGFIFVLRYYFRMI